jgi:hypothetical protein
MQIPDLPEECESQRCHYQPYSWPNYEAHFQHAHPRRRNGRPDLLAFAHQMGLTNEEEEDVQITDDEDPDDTDEEFPLDDEQVDDHPHPHPQPHLPVQALPQVPADVMEDLRSDLDQREAMYLMHRNAARNKFDQIVALIASLPELQQHETSSTILLCLRSLQKSTKVTTTQNTNKILLFILLIR